MFIGIIYFCTERSRSSSYITSKKIKSVWCSSGTLVPIRGNKWCTDKPWLRLIIVAFRWTGRPNESDATMFFYGNINNEVYTKVFHCENILHNEEKNFHYFVFLVKWIFVKQMSLYGIASCTANRLTSQRVVSRTAVLRCCWVPQSPGPRCCIGLQDKQWQYMNFLSVQETCLIHFNISTVWQ